MVVIFPPKLSEIINIRVYATIDIVANLNDHILSLWPLDKKYPATNKGNEAKCKMFKEEKNATKLFPKMESEKWKWRCAPFITPFIFEAVPARKRRTEPISIFL